MKKIVIAAAACAAVWMACAADGVVDVTTLGVKNDASADVSALVNEATKTNALYFPPGRYLVEKPIVLCHSIYGKGFSRCPDKVGRAPEPDQTRTWFISRLVCTNGEEAVISFGDQRNINVEEVNFMCNSAETVIRVLPGNPGNYAFISKIGIYQLGGTGISIECRGSRPIFVQDISIWGSTRRYFPGSRGLFVGAWDCRLSNIEVMAAQIGLEVHGGYTYGENLHLWTGCMAKEGDKAAWWKGTRALKCAAGAHFVGSNIYPDTSYYPFEFVGKRCIVDIRGIMYWDDRSEKGCEDRNGALLTCEADVDPCLKIDGGFWGVCGTEEDPHWMSHLYQPKAEIRNVTVRSRMDVKGANLETLCMNTDLPDYRVDYATNGWCKVAEVFTVEKSGACEGTFTLDDGAAWTFSFLKTPDAPVTFDARELNALCAGREIRSQPGDGTLKVFLRSDAPFGGRFVTTRMTPRFRPVDYGHLRTHDGAVRYREVSRATSVGNVMYDHSEPVDLPPLMRMSDGRTVASVADWEKHRRPEILDFVTRNVYGVRPVERPDDLRFEPIGDDLEMPEISAVRKRVRISFSGPRGKWAFEVCVFLPKSASASKPAPAFLLICNRPLAQYADIDRKVRSGFFPVEEIVRRGYAAAVFKNTELALDSYLPFYGPDGTAVIQDPSFEKGFYACWAKERTEESWGAISVWAWGASRVLDWLETVPAVDARRVAVVGHSRGGKTSLWAAASDTRFAMACVNDSGCCGAKLNHVAVSGSETIREDNNNNPHWFSRAYRQFNGRDAVLPFDQHWIAALVAPRLLYIASASKDKDAGPWGEFLTARHASPAWELYGKAGLVEDHPYRIGDPFQKGLVGYHLREGVHNLTSEDWMHYLDFADRHLISR